MITSPLEAKPAHSVEKVEIPCPAHVIPSELVAIVFVELPPAIKRVPVQKTALP